MRQADCREEASRRRDASEAVLTLSHRKPSVVLVVALSARAGRGDAEEARPDHQELAWGGEGLVEDLDWVAEVEVAIGVVRLQGVLLDVVIWLLSLRLREDSARQNSRTGVIRPLKYPH